MTTTDLPSNERVSTVDELAGSAVLPFVLAAIALVSRIPFRSRVLHHWDSVNFALALERYDVAVHQPHPPGTNVLYIALGRMLRPMFVDSNADLVAVSIVATAAAAMLISILAGRWFGERAAVIAPALVLSSPLVWFYGDVALTYVAELACVAAVLLVADGILGGESDAIVPFSFFVGLSGGIRTDTWLFLLPVWCVVMFTVRKRYRRADLLGSLSVLVAGTLLWSGFTIYLTGGWSRYFTAVTAWKTSFVSESINGLGFAKRLIRFVVFISFALGAALPLLPLAFRRAALSRLTRHRRMLLVAITVPPIVGYLAVHLRQPGHIFTILALVFVMASGAIVESPARAVRRAPYVFVAVIALLNTFAFLTLPAHLFGSHLALLDAPSRRSITAYDLDISQRLRVVRRNFAPEGTLIVAGPRNFRIPDFYLRDYERARVLAGSVRIEIQPATSEVVLFDDDVALSDPAKVFEMKVVGEPPLRIFERHPRRNGAAVVTVTPMRE